MRLKKVSGYRVDCEERTQKKPRFCFKALSDEVQVPTIRDTPQSLEDTGQSC